MFLNRLKRTNRERSLVAPCQHVLLAVSGGADSTALLVAFRELAPAMNLQLTVAHLNHGIRGREADADARFVEDAARGMGVAAVVGRANVPLRARTRGVSLEMAAREARYDFLRRTARQVGADVVATAHTADDQAETVLLRLVRGAGPQGLGGIRADVMLRGMRVVRPMLDVTRSEVVGFLRGCGVSWREDTTNRELSYQRNRVRHEVLPLIESTLNPRVRKSLIRAADVIDQENRWLDTLAAGILAGAGADRRIRGRRVRALQTAPLAELPAAARRRVFRLWLASVGVPPETIDFDVTSRIESLLKRKAGGGRTVLAGGWEVRRRYGELVAERRAVFASFRVSITVPGETEVEQAGIEVRATLAEGVVRDRRSRPGRVPARASISREALGRKRIYVRSWRPGDRVKPLGMRGTRKLQDVLVDAKVPAAERAEVPLFECGGEIIWVPGYCVARGWEVRDPGAPALQLVVTALHGARGRSGTQGKAVRA